MNDEVEAVLRTLPRKIKVGAYDWRIKIASGDNDEWGITEFDKYQITIWPDDMPHAHFCAGIVLHELYHVIFGNEELENVTEEETIVTGFERGTVALLRDNPKLLNWIKRGLKQQRGDC